MAAQTWNPAVQKSKENDSLSDGHDTSHSSDESILNVDNEQAIHDLWRDHYLTTYDKSLRNFCEEKQLDYEDFALYISSTYSEDPSAEEDLRMKNIHENDVNFPTITNICF